MQETTCSAGDPGSIPESGGSPGEGNGNPLPCSCLENPGDRGAWSTGSPESDRSHPAPLPGVRKQLTGSGLTQQGPPSHSLHLQGSGLIGHFTAAKICRARSRKRPGFTWTLSRKETRVWGTSRGSASTGKAAYVCPVDPYS